jgi:hypothetical protein
VFYYVPDSDSKAVFIKPKKYKKGRKAEDKEERPTKH